MSALVISSYSSLAKQEEFPNVANTRRKKDQLNEENLSQFLNSVQNLLQKYKMYSKSPSPQVTSGGLQQFITRKMKEKFHDGGDSLSFIQRLKVFYSKDESISMDYACETDKNNLFQCLPVSVSHTCDLV